MRAIMARKVTNTAAACKYADNEMINTTDNGERTSSNRAADAHSTPTPEKPSFLAHISKPIGRKKLCYELHISKHLLDMWISGERKDPIERVRDLMRVAARCYGPDLPLDIAQELVDEFGGVVLMRRKPAGDGTGEKQ